MANATPGSTDSDFGVAQKKPSDRIQCVVVTPERTLLDDLVEFVALPLLDGELGVLPGRSPLLGRLGFGELRTKTSGQSHSYFIDGGFAQVRDDVVTVLTNRATPVEQLDLEVARLELERGKALRSRTEEEAVERTRLLDRSRAILRVGNQPSRR